MIDISPPEHRVICLLGLLIIIKIVLPAGAKFKYICLWAIYKELESLSSGLLVVTRTHSMYHICLAWDLHHPGDLGGQEEPI